MISENELFKKLGKIKNLEENKKCFDCGEKGTTYICIDFGTFICSRCAGILRELHLKVKGINVSIFNEKEIATIEKNGNKKAQKIWMAKYDIDKDKKPNPKDDDSFRLFLDIKYKEKRWYKKPKKNNKIIKNDKKNKEEIKDYELEEEKNKDRYEEKSSKQKSLDNLNKKVDNLKKLKKNEKKNSSFSSSSSSSDEEENEEKDNTKNPERKDEFKEKKNNAILKIKIAHRKNSHLIKSQKSKNDEKNGEETYEFSEKNLNKDSTNNNIIQQKTQDNNYNLLDVFSPTNLENENTLNDNSMFNVINETNIQNKKNFLEYDFTNPNNPENKEKLEKQKRLDDLTKALNDLNMASTNRNINYLNFGNYMIDPRNYNSQMMVQNAHIGMDMNYMYNERIKELNFSNNNSFPFTHLNSQISHNYFIKQNQDYNNTFSFI